tara:strand:+ start:431 stop:550 length:120 start_codon:yes stop_codon:yes gene_type:complete
MIAKFKRRMGAISGSDMSNRSEEIWDGYLSLVNKTPSFQ